MGNMGTIKLNCRPVNNGSPHTGKFFVTRCGKAFICRLKQSMIFEVICFKKGVYTDTSNNTNQDVDVVPRVKDLGYDYKQLYKKWEKHLPLGKCTGDPKQDLIKVFPKQFEGIGLLSREYNIDMKPHMVPMQLSERNVPESQ